MRRVLFVLGFAIAASLAGLHLARKYSPSDPWKPFANRAQEFLAAAIADDTATVARLAASARLVSRHHRMAYPL